MSKIVVMMTDTQRKDMLGCYGNADMKTPNLDRLAGEGVRFEQAYTCQPVCGPARSSLFAGTYPHSNGVWSNNLALGDNVKTIGQRLSDKGVHTAYIGKWHLDGGDYFGLGRCPDGWDERYWYDMRSYLEELTPQQRRDSRQQSHNASEDLTEEFTFGHRVSNRAIDFLSKYGDEDFLLVVSYDEPHGPYLCPKPYSQMYKGYEFPKSRNVYDDLANKPEHHRVWAGEAVDEDKDALTITADDFFGCNSFVDYEIGRVIDAIDQHAADATVIYTTDHGDLMCSHSMIGKGPAMYDEITNIPFVVRTSDRANADTVCNQLVSHVDVVPTIMELMGLSQPRILEGTSIVPLLKDPAVRVNEAVFMEFGRYEIDHDGFGGFQPVRAVFDGRFKLVINLLCTDELYDLENDDQELDNLITAERHAAIRDELHDKLLDWMNRTRDPFRGYYWERRPWRTDARKATWSYTSMTRQRENEEYEPRQLDYDTGLEMTEAVRRK